MDEKIIARGTLKDSKAFCMALPIIGLIVTIIYDFSVSHGRLSYGFGFGNGANLVLYPLIIVLAIVAFVIYKGGRRYRLQSQTNGYTALMQWGKELICLWTQLLLWG